jgi:hypothetical protein
MMLLRHDDNEGDYDDTKDDDNDDGDDGDTLTLTTGDARQNQHSDDWLLRSAGRPFAHPSM